MERRGGCYLLCSYLPRSNRWMVLMNDGAKEREKGRKIVKLL